METLFSFIAAAILSIPSSIIQGWALSTLWGWFVKPLFANLPHLSTMQSVGIILTVSLFQFRNYNSVEQVRRAVAEKDSSEMRMAVKSSVMAILSPALIVAISWVWRTILM